MDMFSRHMDQYTYMERPIIIIFQRPVAMKIY